MKLRATLPPIFALCASAILGAPALIITRKGLAAIGAPRPEKPEEEE